MITMHLPEKIVDIEEADEDEDEDDDEDAAPSSLLGLDEEDQDEDEEDEHGSPLGGDGHVDVDDNDTGLPSRRIVSKRPTNDLHDDNLIESDGNLFMNQIVQRGNEGSKDELKQSNQASKAAVKPPPTPVTTSAVTRHQSLFDGRGASNGVQVLTVAHRNDSLENGHQPYQNSSSTSNSNQVQLAAGKINRGTNGPKDAIGYEESKQNRSISSSASTVANQHPQHPRHHHHHPLTDRYLKQQQQQQQLHR